MIVFSAMLAKHMIVIFIGYLVTVHRPDAPSCILAELSE
jgi:hypothetical protein